MLKNKSYCSNSFEELANLKGETIKGVFHDTSSHKTYIIFQSDHSFWFNYSGAYGIAMPDETKAIIEDLEIKLKQAEIALEELLKLAGE
jgi:hypothetical protein